VSYLPFQPGVPYAGSKFAHRLRCGVALVMFLFGAAAIVTFPFAALREHF
jgi:hypothetical protein